MTGWDALGWLCFGVAALAVATPVLLLLGWSVVWTVSRIARWWRVP